MEDADGLSFDFEGGLDAAPAQPTASVPVVQSDNSAAAASVAPSGNWAAGASADPAAAAAAALGGAGRGRSFRQTVCRHWLRGLCMKGDACGFLHQYDKSRMPVCRFFRLYGECREQDCVYKHTNEDIKECNMYKLGFCPNGPDCRYRHAKLPGPPPSVEEVFQKIQQLTSYNHGPNRFYQQRNAVSQPTDKAQSQGLNTMNQGQPQESGNLQQQQQQQEAQQSQQQVSQAQIQNSHENVPNQTNRTAHPLPQGVTRYFIVKSCNRENLELSVQQGVWATQRSNEAKLNEAFDSVENVILIFSVNKTRHFQGCAKMTSRIGGSVGGGNWKHEHGTAQYGRNFSVKWLKLCELSFHKTRHLRNPYNDNLPVKISRDCQELEPSIGEQLASLLYLEPDSELMAISLAAELKREEEKSKGVNPESGGDPDIVPFEDNEDEEEEEEEESEEEEDGTGAAAFHGRGRGRGMMWPPQMPLARGARPMPGMGGFPLGVMGADGFPYGPPVGPGGFPMSDPFGVAPRPFGPYGPRFPGMMFPGRPPQAYPPGGFGMIGGQGRSGPMMGGMGPAAANAGRAGRPMFPPPPPPASQNASARGGSRDQRPLINDPNERNDGGPDKGKVDQEMAGPNHEGDRFDARNEESGSEDEAPRRSRHGEGKKIR